MWLGRRRGHLIDWSTQRWVEWTGRRVELKDAPWLTGPVGSTDMIGVDFFERLASAEGLRVERHRTGKGLLPSFSALAGPSFDPTRVDPAVVDFYERAVEFEIDVWSEWSGFFRPFGAAVAAIFSRRLEQLNLPLSPLDTSHGMTSEVLQLTDPVSGVLHVNAWLRTLVKTGRTMYVGSYSTATPPGALGPCVKTVFPLPNGNAIVLLAPTIGAGGSLHLSSSGRRFGDPGFYFTVQGRPGTVEARYLRTFRESIHVYRSASSEVRADHTMSLWGRRCLHLHYRMRRPVDRTDDRRRDGADPAAPPQSTAHRPRGE